MKEKKPLDPITKAKLLIQGEYLLISLVFLVMGILKLVGVFVSDPAETSADVRFKIFNFVTLLGGIWMLVDFIWSTVSPRRRFKVTYLDKVLGLPLALYIIPFDIISLVVWNWGGIPEWNRFGLGVFFIMVFLSYSFQAVYHWFFPTKALLAAVEADEQAKQEALEEQKKQEEQSQPKDKKEE